MSFNKNASKRLSIIAGVERESRDITDIINSISQKYLFTLLNQLVNIILYSGRKTISVHDVRFLPQLCPEYPYIACATTLTKMTKLRIKRDDLEDVLRQRKGYSVYTLKKPFESLVRDIIHKLHDEEIRLGKNVVQLLQNLTEHHIIDIMNRAATYTIRDKRDTLLPRDINTVLKISGGC